MGDADPFQTLHQLRAMLDAAGRAPDRRRGQNFLIDRNLMMKLVEAADLGPRDCVLEVGAGTGSLTGLLAQRAGAVIAVEIDKHLFPIVSENLASYSNVTLLHTDALARKSAVAPEVLQTVTAAAKALGGSIKLVANLPYDIATSLVINLLVGAVRVERFCFTVQTEVADRFLAKCDTKEYGPVSIVSDILAVGRRICKAPPEAFWPRPKVHSTMVALDLRPPDEVPIGDPAAFSSFVRQFFLHRRKTMAHIARTLPQAAKLSDAMSQADVNGKTRPECVSPRQWLELFLHSR